MLNKKLLFSLILTMAPSLSLFAMEQISQERLAKLIALQSQVNQQLIAACKEWRSEDKIDQLLASGADVDATDESGTSALMHAANHSLDEVCRILINAHAQIDAKNNSGFTALMFAANRGRYAICKRLINDGANIEAKNHNGWTALTIATSHGYASTCTLLINHGANIEIKNNNGRTLLMIAASSGYKPICDVLIDHGAQVNTKSPHGATALIEAALAGHESICKLLIDKGAKIDYTLLVATQKNRIEIIKTLISYSTFHPFLSDEQFKISRQRIWAALSVFKRIYPTLPKDIRKLILCSLPELKSDVINSGIFGITEKQTPFAPLPLVRLLIKGKKLDSKKTVAAIQAYHFKCIKTPMLEAMLDASNDTLRTLLNPARLEENFGKAITQNILRRLGLPLTATAKDTDSITDSCSVQ